MNNLELDHNTKAVAKFIVVAQSPAKDENIEHPLRNTESGRRFNMWLEAAGLLGYEFSITNAIKRVIQPGETISLADQIKDTETLNVELQPFKHVICLGKVASNAVAKLEFKDKVILNLSHPSGLNRELNNPEHVKSIINALKEFKKVL